jgi:hypothetical protein
MPKLIKRYFKPDYFNRFLNNFNFLFEKIKKSKGELDLRIRDNYFNLYYKGCSLSKVAFRQNDYEITIHKKFANKVFTSDKRIKNIGRNNENYSRYKLKDSLLRPFFQKKYLDKMCSRIKKENYGEEIIFEHMLITDNLNRAGMIIIDRQITDTALNGKRVDLLALKRTKGNEYRFWVLEVKMGNNNELAGEVGKQIKSYVNHISGNQNFNAWKQCYEENYRQMKMAGLLIVPPYKEIEIVKGVEGIVIVGAYSGIGNEKIADLKKRYPHIKVKQYKNLL